jgi:hypothetical protein
MSELKAQAEGSSYFHGDKESHLLLPSLGYFYHQPRKYGVLPYLCSNCVEMPKKRELEKETKGEATEERGKEDINFQCQGHIRAEFGEETKGFIQLALGLPRSELGFSVDFHGCTATWLRPNGFNKEDPRQEQRFFNILPHIPHVSDAKGGFFETLLEVDGKEMDRSRPDWLCDNYDFFGGPPDSITCACYHVFRCNGHVSLPAFIDTLSALLAAKQ